MPLTNNFQFACQVSILAGVALDFAAGGFGNAHGLDQDDSEHLQIVFLCHGLANGGCHFIDIRITVLACDLLRDDKSFLASLGHRKGRPRAGLQGLMRGLYRLIQCLEGNDCFRE